MRGILCLTCTNLNGMTSDIKNDTSRYLYDIFIIDNPEFKKPILENIQQNFHLSKANTLRQRNFP